MNPKLGSALAAITLVFAVSAPGAAAPADPGSADAHFRSIHTQEWKWRVAYAAFIADGGTSPYPAER